MIRKFKEFWADYWKLCTASGEWLKKHWLGYIIFCIVVFLLTYGATMAWLWYDSPTQRFKRAIKKAPTMSMDELDSL